MCFSMEKGMELIGPPRLLFLGRCCCSSKHTFLEKKILKKLRNLVKSLSYCSIIKYFINLGISDNLSERLL